MAGTPLTSLIRSPAVAAEPFSFDGLTAKMKQKAASPYAEPKPSLPDFISKLTYDDYMRIAYRPDKAIRLDDNSGFMLQAFHLGWLYAEPVAVYLVTDGSDDPITFETADFEYQNAAMAATMAGKELPGVAGLRINYQMNEAAKYDEVVAFLGKSYFRALGRGNLYGGSARGVVLNSWVEGPEEFPSFTAFYLQHGKAGEPQTFYAELEGPTVTGAYKFVLTPGNDQHEDTQIEVTARLFFRGDVKELGIAPLTSMFLFAETNRDAFDDYRPQVHDSNGLYLRRKDGEELWRALNNPQSLANSYFAEENPAAFGLMQRDRDFATYQDAFAHYEKRPSILVEPLGDWGKGSIRLIESPAKLEVDDNIIAFWVPAAPVKAGDALELSYRLRWGALAPDPKGPLAHVVETRAGLGGVSGVDNGATLRKFVIDFAGGPLSGMEPSTKLDVVATVSAGSVHYATASAVPEAGVWRLAIDAEIDTKDPVELRAYLVGGGRQLTETWLYQWRAATA